MGGISDNIKFNYMNTEQFEQLLIDTEQALEKVGYVSSDKATKNDKYIYSSPLHKKSITVFKKEDKN
ncbi:MAG: hypothetical protein U9R37_04960 [Campylobacterota bacterium]|nr:hypothetical protein [Campylobacterota bacterium]